MTKDLMVSDKTNGFASLPITKVRQQVNDIQRLMASVMKEGEHFGVIPGTNKKSLYKAGAEKIGLTFRLAPHYEVTEKMLDKGHLMVTVKCILQQITSGQVWGEGLGICSTMEPKYRYRILSPKCPKCGKHAIMKGKKEYGGGWLCWTKREGCGAKFKDGDASIESQPAGKVEHPDPAEYYNTVIKMAKKRAHVDAILTATAASDIFTQDLQEDKEPLEGGNGKAA